MKSKKYAYAGISAAIAITTMIIIFTQFNIPQKSANDKEVVSQLQPQQPTNFTPSGAQTTPSSTQQEVSALDLDFSYEKANSDLKKILLTHGINMSNPLRFSSQSYISQYCNFLSDPKKQALIKFCTSTELKDKNGNFLGNIDMVGSHTAPGLVIVALQSNPILTNYDDVKTVFGSVINETVCQCWDKAKPGSYATLSNMMNALRDFHINGKEPNSTTHSIPLADKHFEIELSTNEQGYLWKLLVAR